MTFLVISLLLALTCFTNGKSVNQSQIFGEPFDKLKIFSSLLQNPSNMTEPSEKYSGGITCNYYWSGSSNLLDQSTSQNTQYCPPGLPCFSGTGSRGSTWFKVGGCVTRLGNAGYSAPFQNHCSSSTEYVNGVGNMDIHVCTCTTDYCNSGSKLSLGNIQLLVVFLLSLIGFFSI